MQFWCENWNFTMIFMICCCISRLQLQSCNHFHEKQPWTMLFWRSELEMDLMAPHIICGAGDPYFEMGRTIISKSGALV